MFINRRRREINLKIVYYGPPLSGKTTNLQMLFERTPERHRSNLMSIKTDGDRTLFFDFLQVEMGSILGLTPKFKLYTVPGQSYYRSSRRLVLQGVDGVVFVADATPGRMQENIQSWQGLQEHLTSYRLDPATFPIVVQVNKRDVPFALHPLQVTRALEAEGRPVIESVASTGQGVTATLKQVIQAVLRQNQALLSSAPPAATDQKVP